MASYNRVNGTYATENRYLLKDILKDEWGYDGVVVSDWGAVHATAEAANGGNDLEMPGPPLWFGERLMQRVEAGEVAVSTIDEAARRMVRLILRTGVLDGKPPPAGELRTQRHREIAARAAEKEVRAIDAPVSGGDVGAREARLSIMIGGDEAAVAALEPSWTAMGKTWVRQGGPGAGQHTKMVNQILIASGMVGVCEALLYAHRAGLDPERVLQSVASGAAGSWSLTNYGPRILAGNFEPGFFVEHFIKDMAIALDEARRLQLALPGLALAQQLYQSVQALGYGRKGTHALQLALAAMSGVDWSRR